MAFHTIWSVDLGKSALKAVKLRRERNNVEILAIDKVDYPISQNGVDSVDEASKEALAIFRSRNEVREPLVVSHPGQGTFSRFIKIPAFDAKKVQDMVQYEASQQIPFPLDEVIWDFHIVDRDYLSGEERDVGLFAVRREAIDDFLLDFVQEGLSVEVLPIGYLALFNFIKYDLNPQEPSVVLDIGAAHTDLILIDGERFWVRPLPHSGHEVTRAIMNRFKLKFSEAERLKTEAVKAPKQAAKIFQAVIQPKLKDLVQEVQRSLGYYRSQSGDVNFEKLYLLGNGSRVLGIKKYLQDQLGMPVERVQSIHHLRINRDVNVKLLQAQLPAFGTALGAGLQALGAGACQVDLVPREEKLKKAAERKKKHVYFAALALLGFVLVSYFLTSSKLRDAENALQEARELPRQEILPYEKELARIEDPKEGDALYAKRAALLGIAEARSGALQGLRLLDSVLARLPNDDPVEANTTVGDDEAIRQAVVDGRKNLDEKLWVPYLRVTRVEWPEDPEGSSRRRASSSGRRRPGDDAKPDAEKVPGYKFEAYAVVRYSGVDTEAIKQVQERLLEPLEQQLGLSSFSVLNEVSLGTGKANRQHLMVDMESDGLGGSIEQEGGPFYGAPLTWYVVPRVPEHMKKQAGAAQPDAEEADEGTGFEF